MKDSKLIMDSKHAELAIKLQALWRRYRVRKMLLETRKEFIAICHEIDEDFDPLLVTWPSQICQPHFLGQGENKKNSLGPVRKAKKPLDKHSDESKPVEGPSFVETSTPRENIQENNRIDENQCSDAEKMKCTFTGESDFVKVVDNSACTSKLSELASSESVVNCSSNEEVTEVEHKDISCQTSICFDDHVDLTSLKSKMQPTQW